MKLAPLDNSSAKKFRAYKILVEHFHQNINQCLLLTLRDTAKWTISRSSSRQTVFLGKLLHISTSWQWNGSFHKLSSNTLKGFQQSMSTPTTIFVT